MACSKLSVRLWATFLLSFELISLPAFGRVELGVIILYVLGLPAHASVEGAISAVVSIVGWCALGVDGAHLGGVKLLVIFVKGGCGMQGLELGGGVFGRGQ